MANVKFRGDSRRRGFYERRIERWLDAHGFGPRQRERIESVGWSKLAQYVHLLSRNERSPNYHERWTAFAERDDVTVEIVQQAAERGRPSVPADERIRTMLLRLPRPLHDALDDALKKRGGPREKGRRDGLRRVQSAVKRLLKDAGDWPPH